MLSYLAIRYYPCIVLTCITCIYNHTIIEWFLLEGTVKSHPVQPPCNEQGCSTYNILAKKKLFSHIKLPLTSHEQNLQDCSHSGSQDSKNWQQPHDSYTWGQTAAASVQHEAITSVIVEEGDAILVFPIQCPLPYHAEWEQTTFLSRKHFKAILRVRIMMCNFTDHVI